MTWSDSLATVVRLGAIPYGYTIVIWSAGAISISSFGWPKSKHIVLFVLGAVVGYLVFAVLSLISNGSDLATQNPLKGAALLNMVPVLPAVMTALVVKGLHQTAFGYFIVSLSCTTSYMAGMLLLLHFANRVQW